MAEIQSKPLAMVALWAVLLFNGLFMWYTLDPRATPKATAPPPAEDAPAMRRFTFRQTHMGSEFTLILYCNDEPTARRASDLAFARIAALDAALSDYKPDSELMQLCDRAGGPAVAVGDDLYRVLDRSLDMARRSDGAFDPTVGPVVRLWRRARRTRERPDPKLLVQARARVGYQKVRLDPEKRTATLEAEGMKLDLGGIAKGYASDQAIATLKANGVKIALAAGAGDIVASDPPPGAEGWTVGVAPLDAREGQPERFVSLRNAAVSTSGDAERFVEIDGVRYSHIVDPRTGLGLTGRSSVTTFAPDGTTADALATAVSVLGPEKGLPLVEATEGAAAFIVRAGKEGIETFESARWKLVPKAKPKSADASLKPSG